MKFKSLFLGMLGAAVMFSCNNDAIEPGPDGPNPDGGVVEGLPVYASFDIRLGNNTTTYAGEENVTASPQEQEVDDVLMYVYKWDGVSTYPEYAVYVSGLTGTGTGKKVTMKAKTGTKKIFVACNAVRTSGTPLNMIPIKNTSNVNLSVVSEEWDLSYSALNNTLYTASATTWDMTPVPAGSITMKADGLIKALAKNDIFQGATPGQYSGTENMLMTNWDGPDDVANGIGTTHTATCQFLLAADIDSTASNAGVANDPSKNAFGINVQRAFAKITLNTSIAPTTNVAPALIPAGFTTSGYRGANIGDNHEGEFHPWGSGATVASWSLGNIPKATLPFQQYYGGSVRDMYYTLKNDSATTTSGFPNWVSHYDNTRVFPTTLTSYPSATLTVTNVKDVMTATGNFTTFGNYAYSTESARAHPVLESQQPYVIVGGRYYPKRVVTSIVRAAVETNNPTINYGADWSYAPATGDTLYYVVSDQIFISGLDNLKGYYAWQKKNQISAPADFSGFTSATTDAINAARGAKDLLSYFEAQCWYRIFITDESQPLNDDKVMVRRNHYYDVNIRTIKGPGIADPNDILDDIPVLPEDTYVTATINVLPWHKVKQDADVDQN